MNIIIAGCGKVGYKLAEQMVEEGHDITMIDRVFDRLKETIGELDVQGIVGSCTSVRTLQEAGVEKADLFIAVTASDETNLLGCLIAKKSSTCKTVARVRDPEFFTEREYLKQCMDISLIINPEFSAAREIAHLIQTPSATEVDTFAKGKVDLMKMEIPQGSVLDGMDVVEFSKRFNRQALICVLVHRDGEDQKVEIPNGQSVLHSGDTIYVILPPSKVRSFCRDIGLSVRPLKDVMIVGGSKICYYLTRRLLRNGISVKIIEKNEQRCRELCESLNGVMVINGDATDYDILLEEGLERMDAFVALTNVEEENVFMALFANRIAPNSKKITKNNRLSLERVIGDLPVGSIISPKFITAEYISQYVRSLDQSNSSEVESVYQLVDNQVEALEFTLKEDSPVTGKPLQELKLKKGVLVCCIVRGGTIITPGGRDMLLKGDTVIIVTTIKGLGDIRGILEK